MTLSLAVVSDLPAAEPLSPLAVVGSVRMSGLDAYDSDSIANDAPNQWRWLSVPHSRLVLNPASAGSFAPLPRRADLPLHVGYYAGQRPQRLLDLVAVSVRPEAAKEPQTWAFKSEPGKEFCDPKESWRTENVVIAVENGLGKITVPPSGAGKNESRVRYGAAILRVRPPFQGRSGSIRIKIDRTDGAWALKLNTGDETDMVIQGDTEASGTFVYRFTGAQAWPSRDGFDIKIFAIHPGKSVWVKSLDIAIDRDGAAGAADAYETCWYPYQLSFKATYNDAGVTLRGADFFHDENTIVRILDIKRRGPVGASTPVLELSGVTAGEHGEVPSLSERSMLFEYPDFYCAIVFARLLSEDLTATELQLTPTREDWIWKLRVPVGGHRQRIAVSIGFAVRSEGASEAIHRARALLEGEGFRASLANRKAQWDRCLQQVPAPMVFGIQAIDAKGVTPAQHRQFYYGAWTFVLSNVLPPMPENSFLFPQTPAGKPSMWNYGASRARASAAWESFLAQQLLGHVMPDVAWKAFEGIMTQVDEDGWLDGECLPSRKAQTAWVLYSLTDDRERLSRVYAPIKRYLRWREQNPRWIHKDHNYPDEKDASFVDQLLVDIDFAVRIADALGEKADVQMLREQRARILKNYREWFFFNDGRPPVEYYDTGSGKHMDGYYNWVCSGLHIRNLPPDLVDDLKQLYLSHHDRSLDLAGHPSVKYGTISFVAYGLLEQGLHTEARELINAVLRDQIRAGEFSENYHREADPPIASTGVKPSFFGAGQMIDFTLMNNGVRIDQGRPHVLTGW